MRTQALGTHALVSCEEQTLQNGGPSFRLLCAQPRHVDGASAMSRDVTACRLSAPPTTDRQLLTWPHTVALFVVVCGNAAIIAG